MSHNTITGDRIATKPASDKFREGWARLFERKAACCEAMPMGCRQGRDCPLRADECKLKDGGKDG